MVLLPRIVRDAGVGFASGRLVCGLVLPVHGDLNRLESDTPWVSRLRRYGSKE